MIKYIYLTRFNFTSQTELLNRLNDYHQHHIPVIRDETIVEDIQSGVCFIEIECIPVEQINKDYLHETS